MRSLYIYLVLILLSTSCLNFNRPETQIRYKEHRAQVLDTLVDFFPSKISNNCIRFRFNNIPATIKGTHSSLVVVEKLKRNQFEILRNKYNSIAIQICKFNDECNQIVNRYSRQESDSLYKIKLNEQIMYCENLSIPIINFQESDYFLIDSLDAPFCEVFILKSRKGEYSIEENLTSGVGLLDEWKNGFSSGVLFNDTKNEIIYWFIKW